MAGHVQLCVFGLWCGHSLGAIIEGGGVAEARIQAPPPLRSNRSCPRGARVELDRRRDEGRGGSDGDGRLIS
ncbi:hypothetical protein LX36DRAFT_662518 [Colletotrichum falcatum]|nr:hypothetical protein LX36DRAFT_662518 [Colletotrichum falcatum]